MDKNSSLSREKKNNQKKEIGIRHEIQELKRGNPDYFVYTVDV